MDPHLGGRLHGRRSSVTQVDHRSVTCCTARGPLAHNRWPTRFSNAVPTWIGHSEDLKPYGSATEPEKDILNLRYGDWR